MFHSKYNILQKRHIVLLLGGKTGFQGHICPIKIVVAFEIPPTSSTWPAQCTRNRNHFLTKRHVGVMVFESRGSKKHSCDGWCRPGANYPRKREASQKPVSGIEGSCRGGDGIRDTVSWCEVCLAVCGICGFVRDASAVLTHLRIRGR